MFQAEAKSNRVDRIGKPRRTLLTENLNSARKALGAAFGARAKVVLGSLTREFGFSLKSGDLQIINSNWAPTFLAPTMSSRQVTIRSMTRWAKSGLTPITAITS